MLLDTFFKSDGEGKLALDLGCGSGRDSIYLLERGWRVISIDTSETALNVLESKANTNNKSWLETKKLVTKKMNIEDYDFPEKAHLIVAHDVFPYCNPEKIRSLWTRIHASIEDNGYLVGTFFQRGGFAHRKWTAWGAWFVNDSKTVETLVTRSSYKMELCRYRPKDRPSSVIEFLAQKTAPDDAAK